jgi:hypothetical protein
MPDFADGGAPFTLGHPRGIVEPDRRGLAASARVKPRESGTMLRTTGLARPSAVE